MATRFVNIDRNTPMLLPPDLRDWVPEEDMVHFVIEAVGGMSLRGFKINRRGSGSQQYTDAWKTLEKEKVDLYVTVGREENHSQRRYDFRPESKTKNNLRIQAPEHIKPKERN